MLTLLLFSVYGSVAYSFVRVLNERQAQAGALLQAAQHMQASIHALRAAAEKVLLQLQKPAPTLPPTAVSGNGSETWPVGILSFLARWQASGASEDCSLPELYRQAQQLAPPLTIGQFHDGLRRLYQQEQIYLHPWTGPLYDLPEPPYALLAGHEIAYYASLRNNENR